MPCASGSYLTKPNQPVVDLLEIHPFVAGTCYIPRSKSELVGAVVSADSGHRTLRALGSAWSLSEAHVARGGDVIDTSRLNCHLSDPFPAGTGSLAANRLTDSPASTLATMCEGHADELRAAKRHFVHVEAGITIRQLLADLKVCGLALPTMGAGGGQSLAGATSTSTHGGDLDVPPLVEWIRAVHLIGSNGQEWWLTPTTSIFADVASTAPALLCYDAKIVADDHAFDAVRVGVGRFGVLYAMVLEVVEGYGIVEANLEHVWSNVRTELATTGMSGPSRTGLFAAPLTDLDRGWVRSNVIDNAPTVPLGLGAFGGDAGHEILLNELGVRALADDLRDGPSRSLRHLNIVVNLCSPDQCWITRRWAVPVTTAVTNMTKPPPDPLVKAVTDSPHDPQTFVHVLRARVEPGWLEGAAAGLIYPDFTERLDNFLNFDIYDMADTCAKQGGTSGELLFLVLYRLLADPLIANRVGDDLRAAVAAALSGDFQRRIRSGAAVDLLDTHDYSFDHAQSGDSAEFFFDAGTKSYLGFADDVVALATKHSPVLGYLALRFTPGATASIAMQRFPLTVALEVATGRARQDDVYADFWADLHRAAAKRGGCPHWGQEFRASDVEIQSLYGESLAGWRQALGELNPSRSTLFRTAFTQSAGLEPLTGTGVYLEDARSLFQASVLL